MQQLRLDHQFEDEAIWRSGNVEDAAQKMRATVIWLRENCGRRIAVSEVARQAAMSERTFLRQFKKHLGVAPSEYLLMVRLERCAALLAETDLPIDKIARRCGLTDGAQLGRLFRNRYMVSPGSYRQANRGREAQDQRYVA
jgi:transcriptional regulator GlxA family with amidase domain